MALPFLRRGRPRGDIYMYLYRIHIYMSIYYLSICICISIYPSLYSVRLNGFALLSGGPSQGRHIYVFISYIYLYVYLSIYLSVYAYPYIHHCIVYASMAVLLLEGPSQVHIYAYHIHIYMSIYLSIYLYMHIHISITV